MGNNFSKNFKNINFKNNWYGLKILIKNFVSVTPFYNKLFASLIKKIFGKNSYKLRRLPIKNLIVDLKVNELNIYLNNPVNDHIAKEIWWCNSQRYPLYEHKALEIFALLARFSDCVLDIGCNNGIFSIIAAKSNPKTTVYAFDILPVALELINQNIITNNVADIVSSRLLGISDLNDNIIMPFEEYNSSIPTSYSTNFKFDRGINVKLITLDNLSSIFNFKEMKNFLVKIDVEGTEDNIFKSGVEFLLTKKPIILCEILNRSNSKFINRLLNKLSFKFYLIKNNGLEEKKEIKPDKFYRDWLFVHKDYEIEKLLNI